MEKLQELLDRLNDAHSEMENRVEMIKEIRLKLSVTHVELSMMDHNGRVLKLVVSDDELIITMLKASIEKIQKSIEADEHTINAIEMLIDTGAEVKS